MRDNSRIPQNGARSSVLIGRLVREFIWRHARKIALAFLFMAIAGGATALRAWLMEPVLDRIFIARDSSLLWLLGSAALGLALVKGVADYAETVLMTRVGQRVITDVQTALYARLIRADLAYFNAQPRCSTRIGRSPSSRFSSSRWPSGQSSRSAGACAASRPTPRSRWAS